MIVKLIWPAQEHDRPVDAFWVECTSKEVTEVLLPRLSADQRSELASLQQRKQAGEVNTHFLIARDLSTIQPMPAIYPYASLWNAYNPFRTIPDLFVATLEAINTIAVDHEAEPTPGPQYPPDGAESFTSKMRFHQSWYRAHVLKRHYGLGPRMHSQKPYGNMLKRDAGEQGANFLTDDIARLAKQYLKQHSGLIERFRLLNNMLSSQPMCFNLFGPLVGDLPRATRLLSALMPGEIARVTEVRIEYAPQPRARYLNDNTAFDAFVRYERMDGTRAFLGIETKLTEPFSQKHYDGEHYRSWTERADSPWPASSWKTLDKMEHNQLWRDHLLAVALRHDPNESYAAGRLMLVRHAEDEGCRTVAENYRSLLNPTDDTFIDMPLGRLVDAWRPLLLDDAERTWLEAFYQRYLNLAASEAAWDAQAPQTKRRTKRAK